MVGLDGKFIAIHHTSVANIFTALQTFSAGLSASGGATFGSDIGVNGVIVGRGGGNFSSNTVLGSGALEANTTGVQNVAIGLHALQGATNASANIAIGRRALRFTTAGDNVAIGNNAGSGLASGSQNVYIGSDVDANSGSSENEIVIGAFTTGRGSNTVTIGNSSVVTTFVSGVLNASSGLSAAGATFASRASFNGGLTANTLFVSGGATFSGPNLVTFTTGITAGQVRSPAILTNSINAPQQSGGTINIATDGGQTVYIGDAYGQSETYNYIEVYDSPSASRVAINSLYGQVVIGDADDNGFSTRMVLDDQTQTLDFYGSRFSIHAGLSAAGATFSGLANFSAGISASGATFTGDIAVNGGDITTTSTTATIFNSNATTLSMGGAGAATVNIGNGTGVTLNIGTGSLFGGVKNINIGSNGTFGNSTINIGNGLSTTNILGSNSGSINLGSLGQAPTVNVQGTLSAKSAANVTGLLTASGGITASGIISTGNIVLVNTSNGTSVQVTSNARSWFL